ncbi:thiamine phosphate synthase [Clostridium sp. 'White wine YQ']|uniref:thiamine phosphate synthase n=1 Tax=Clostridium sp. 'White wine YQ' TaxID=3027474 RepID=UPI00236589E7|nr:thiamine phosphate synthase [Clostridium sp. 'White wine YQ']MDD7796200.1 thiamine phosphate synthase [Clostridium sp. 'White wine YQ']
MSKEVDYTLYLVTDRDMLKNRNIVEAVEEAILGGVTLVQVREKDISTSEFYKVASEIKEVTSKYNVPIIINDRIDIALAIEADGVHVGQSDMPASIARKLIGPDKILGVSTATIDEAIKAEKEGADYLGVGAVFSTTTKDDARNVSLELLKEIKETINIPIVAIGGINSKNVDMLKESDIDGVAVISDILAKDDIKQAARNIKEKF